MLSQPFFVVAPNEDSPLVVEIPHAGTWLEPEAGCYSRAPARCLAYDADLFVDELFAGAVEAGATLLVASLSRYVVDLNTPPAEPSAESLAPGVPDRVDRRSASGDRWSEERPPPAERARRLATFHEPYHLRLASLLEERRNRFGLAVLLSAHSFAEPSRGPEVVVGTRGGESADEALVEVVSGVARRLDWSVAHDDPFAGGYATARHGRPAEGFHAIQIEIARRTHLDLRRLRRTEGFARATQLAQAIVTALVEASRARGRPRLAAPKLL